MRITGIFLLIMVGWASMAQTGPGGVGSSTTNQLWLRANTGVFTDAGVTPAATGNNVQQWNDQSGNSKNCIQLTVGNRPNYTTGVMNGFPVIRYTAANTDRMLSAAVTTGNAASVWVVASWATLPPNNPGLVQGAPSGLGFSTNGNEKCIGLWVSSTSPFRAWGRGVEADNSIISLPNGASFATSVGVTYLYNNLYNGTNLISQFVSGTASSSVAYDGTLKSWTDFGVGNQGGESWNGDIAEVIVYNAFVNTAQRIIIDNYLAAKYGLTGGSNIANDFYTMDNAANGDFDYDVAGIGRFDVTNTHTDSQGSGFVKVSLPTDLFTDGEYFMWGHNNLTAQANNIVDIPSGITARFDRIWRVSEVGEVGNVDVSFDVTGLPDFTSLSACDAANSIRLLIDTDNDGTFADQTAIAGATNVGGNVYRFANVSSINNNFRFTIGIVGSGVTGPGGIGGINGTTNLALWLRANSISQADNTNVSVWSDQSGYANHANAVGGNEPTFRTNIMNGFPAIRFTAANTDYLRVANATTLRPNNISIFLAAKYNSAATSARSPLLIKTTSDSWTDGYGITRDASLASLLTFMTNSAANVVSSALATGTNTLITSVYDNTNVQLFYNETSQGTDPFVTNITNSTNFLYLGIGPDVPGTGVLRPFDGDIAEAIIINRNVNTAERIIINNYLSAKYNIAIAAGSDVYTRDNSINGDFDYEVAGIGRVNVTNTVTDAGGSGIVRVNNAGGMGDGEYFLFGHNNGSLTSTVDDVPAGVIGKYRRIWSVSEVGDVGSIDITFDLTGQTPITASDLRLIIDHDGDGVFNEGGTIVTASATALSCNTYVFSGVATIGDAMRFTIGTANATSTPLPIELLSFNGVLKNGSAELSWATATEHNNDYFTVERSEGGEKFTPLMKVAGAGQSTVRKNYSAVDQFPPAGKAYYRLRQTDYDGAYAYSKIILLTVPFAESNIQVSPNPVRIGDEINVRLINPETPNSSICFQLFDLLGRSLAPESEVKGDGNFVLKMSVIKSPGLYILRIRAANLNRDFYQRIYLSE